MYFSTSKRVYGGLKDQDRIFTNLYKDDDPFIKGALRRVIRIYLINQFNREIGIEPKILLLWDKIGLLMRLKNQDLEVEEVLVSLLDLNTLLCLKYQLMEGKIFIKFLSTSLI